MFWKTFIAFFACIIPFSCRSQTPKVSLPEFGWAIMHPVAAIKVRVITKKCGTQVWRRLAPLSDSSVPDSLQYYFPDNYPNGGKQDALRHIFFMAAYAQKINVKKLRKLGIAHEKASYRHFKKCRLEDGELPDSLSSVMDLHNNEVGFSVGVLNKKADLKKLMALATLEIKRGEALIMKRDGLGTYLTCEGEQLDLILLFKTWNLPKCLVRSNVW